MATSVLSPSALPLSSPSFYDAEYPPPATTTTTATRSNAAAAIATAAVASPTLLSDKIVAALVYEGYDHHSVQKVKKLVARNILVSEIADDSDDNDVEGVVGEMMRAGGVNVNSNEVVLMLDVGNLEARTRKEVEKFKNGVVDVLGREYCIWPVRVYTAKSTKSDGMGVVLLNVVNTDVGSPSMVSLLEHDCPAREWDESIVSTETWGQRNFIWREDKYWRAVDDVVDEKKGPQIQQEELVHEFGYVTPSMTGDVDVESDTGDLSDSMVDVSKLDASVSEDEDVDEIPEKPVKLTEHPAVAELAAREAARAHIQHPTWQHADESSSLIDLVKLHASRSAVTEDTEEVEHSDQTPKVGSEGSFEIV